MKRLGAPKRGSHAMPTEKLTFSGSRGAPLAARLDLPECAPLAYAIFAHCFTCSKDVFAAARISEALALQGIAVLRFDFTGLGASGGDFGNTNFSSNVEDLKLAAAYLRRHYEAPQILIGHSLGGAAVLSVAGDIAEVRAVATINAPADASHVVHSFAMSVADIERDGEAEVTLAGRTFNISKHFLDDVRGQKLAEKIATLRRALLVFHAPGDTVVGINNAAEIFTAAKHPKSFVSLDDADHLLTRRADALYVANVLGSWASRYLDAKAEPQVKDETVPEGVTVRETGRGKFQQQVLSGRHILGADEPIEAGGLDSAPSPYDFLAVALGACTSMTLRNYASLKGIELGRISVKVTHGKVHAQDCVECEGREGRIDRFERRISIEGGFPPELEAKIVEIAGKCPVHRTLEFSSVVATRVTAG
jgi:uncharacterized OsmC-like protein/alpha-beta hydrolase superfamily lysophospholipase